jgi:uncharacterized protein (TIGR02722 family)
MDRKEKSGMKTYSVPVSHIVFAMLLLLWNVGCAAFRASTTTVDVAQERHMGARYDYSDLRNVSQQVVDELLKSPFLQNQPQPPILMVAGIQNRTSRYMDTKALSDKIRTALLQSGKAQFVNEARREDLLKEQGYQAANAAPSAQVQIGKQLGARYMLSGSMVEMESTSPRQVRVSKQELVYYKLTIEVTDLETGLIVWTTEQEFARQQSLPLIGW